MHAQRTEQAADLRRLDNTHVWHPFAPMTAYREEGAPIIERGEGFHLFDVEGRRYLDGISSLWCNVHGHHVPEIDAAVRAQLDRVAHTTLLGLASTPSIELAQQLVERTPRGLTKVFFSDSGATAVEAALKIAFQYHRQRPGGSDERNLFATVRGAYHGDTIGSVSVGSIELFHRVYGKLLFETVSVPSPSGFRFPLGMTQSDYYAHCLDELERVISTHARRLAAFVMEPLVQGAAGILVHPPGYLSRVRQLTTDYGVPLIADEVAVGFGRTGTLFACEQEDVSPDILCLGKGLTGGYLPVAATLATDEIFDAFLGDPSEGRTFFHGHTYTGNPLGCAAAIASLALFEKNRVLENVAASSKLLAGRLRQLADHPHVAEVRQRGVMVGIELVQDRMSGRPFDARLRMGHQVTLAARKRGVILRPLGDVVVLMPAPAMPQELVTTLCDVAFEAINEATRAAAN
ncbi:MAG: adenosylmethionine--8-amino-7-oxononanoate transaminase [Planctomycetaceae bacterium]|nr:adenosylmethionine--8-amino-7-oxononanoate transaminase [Planctomycetaceae bacterium]